MIPLQPPIPCQTTIPFEATIPFQVTIPLQIDPALQSQIALALTVLSTVLGLAVGVIALRGYVRSRKRPMLFVSVGFFLVFWTPVLLLAGPYLVPLIGTFAYGVLGEVSRILGLLCILYGLRMPFVQLD